MSDRLPYIVQRLNVQTRPELHVGFDRHFSLDYMGSSEYEWGAPRNSLLRIRTLTPLVMNRQDITIGDLTRPVWLVLPEKDADTLVQSFLSWSDPSHPQSFRTKERSRFRDVFEGNDDERFTKTVAWWDLLLHFGWTLDEQTADDLMKAFLGE